MFVSPNGYGSVHVVAVAPNKTTANNTLESYTKNSHIFLKQEIARKVKRPIANSDGVRLKRALCNIVITGVFII